MPITFQLDPQNSVLVIKATGSIALPDIMKLLREKDEAGVSTCAQLFDAIDVQLDLSIKDLHRIARETRRLLRGAKMGKVAVVTTSFYFHTIATAYSAITRRENPEFRVFDNMTSAKLWMGFQRPAGAA